MSILGIGFALRLFTENRFGEAVGFAADLIFSEGGEGVLLFLRVTGSSRTGKP